MDAPDRKRLKSTYKAAQDLPSLPPGWTEHTAPTGHKYYYNTATKASTYTRPAAAPSPSLPTPPQAQPAFSPPPAALPTTYTPAQYNSNPAAQYPQSAAAYNPYPSNAQYNPYPPYGQPAFNSAAPSHEPRRRPQPHDRPKRKEVIPNCKPWVVVYTKLGRRFVHNPDTNESFWKFPDDVMKALVDFDRLKLDEKLKSPDEASSANKVAPEDKAKSQEPEKPQEDAAGSDSEYEEIEVTDDEDDEGGAPRQEEGNAEEDGPLEFDEDDIAYQLAAMEDSYGLDRGEFGGGGEDEYEEGMEGIPLTDEDGAALFCDMLEDQHISPYIPWETLISDGRIIDDSRYTALPTTKRRKEVWADWTRTKIVQLREQKAKQEKLDPRIPYLSLLSEKATPKLYWPEFRRKYKKEDAMRDAKLSDKEREKLYREHIARLKLSASQLKSDLIALLKSLPLKHLNRDTRLENLPKDLLIDIRFISLPPKARDDLLEAHISTLAPAPDEEEAATEEERAEQEIRSKERRRREQALREREQKVEEEKRKRERDLAFGRGRLGEAERELELAMKVGRSGLRAQIDEAKEDDE
ncbi:hypothetical protein M436DRAFT_44467 [Aureobasidium namibiae CBS 147.97]|uniref:WW domain-containing protein n=1 Tax=Aureobasidium namibiae CBS 147.97 TaxID=1043004 RepID=A0A074WMN2_9PEZI|nr:uncharacterized protein M436DRAFT_44467 [Aureobasidium namibiae CBS 147.97]KEQ74375.1 hypothetical protein M436DRAFT_44467 [Aureobasidium namibiae CBS 147.97]